MQSCFDYLLKCAAGEKWKAFVYRQLSAFSSHKMLQITFSLPVTINLNSLQRSSVNWRRIVFRSSLNIYLHQKPLILISFSLFSWTFINFLRFLFKLKCLPIPVKNRNFKEKNEQKTLEFSNTRRALNHLQSYDTRFFTRLHSRGHQNKMTT